MYIFNCCTLSQIGTVITYVNLFYSVRLAICKSKLAETLDGMLTSL